MCADSEFKNETSIGFGLKRLFLNHSRCTEVMTYSDWSEASGDGPMAHSLSEALPGSTRRSWLSNHREARSDNSHFLPFTRNPKADSGGRARQNRYFFVAPLLAFPLKKLRIVALYLLSSSKNLPLRSIEVSFFCFENTLKPASSF
jgi:hypothetical protein